MSSATRSLAQADLRPVPVRWLWPPFVAAGTLTLLDGDPGCGKSLLTLDLAARLSRGGPFAGGAAAPPCRTYVLNAEDDPAGAMLPRLSAAGADLEQIFVPNAEDRAALPELPGELPRLEAEVRDLRVGLVVLDSLSTLLPARLAGGPALAVQEFLHPLAGLAERTGAAVLVVRHLTKRPAESALYRGQGSLGIAGVARTVLLAGPHPRTPSVRVLTVVKSNLVAPGPPLRYTLLRRGDAAAVEWLGPDVAAEEDPAGRPSRPERPGVVRATLWLLEALADGPRPAAELLMEARAAGVYERALDQAKRQLGVKSKVTHADDGRRCWLWCPPPKPYVSPFAPLPELEPMEDPRGEVLPEGLSPEAHEVLDRERLKWAGEVLKERRR